MPEYSEIVSGTDYQRMMSEEHIYISDADNIISSTLQRLIKLHDDQGVNIIDLGCGPGRTVCYTPKTGRFKLFAVDKDLKYLTYTEQELMKSMDMSNESVALIHTDITTPDFNKHIIEQGYKDAYPVCVSQGVHHHIEKGKPLTQYLINVKNLITNGGVYILSDEFLAHYNNESERQITAVLWYCHVIAKAQKNKYVDLARGEAETLLDDLHAEEGGFKNEEMVNLVLSKAQEINEAASTIFATKLARSRAFQLISQLRAIIPTTSEIATDMSRGDYKICHAVFQKEVEAVGLQIIGIKTIGPIESLGGMVIYTLSA